MKHLFVVMTFIFCQGCILVSDAKYQVDLAMWQAKAEASKAWAEQSTRPLASFTTATGEVFTVNNPNLPQPMAVAGEPNAIVQGVDVVLNSGVAKILGGGWAAGYMLGKVQGNYTSNGKGDINVTRDSGNSVDVTTRHTEGSDSGIIEEQHSGSDNVATDNRSNYDNTNDSRSEYDNTTDNRSDYDNATATPTVVQFQTEVADD